MKFKWLIFFLAIIFYSCAVNKKLQQTETGITVYITGTTKKLNNARVYVTSENYKTVYWSDSIKNNKFSGKVVVPVTGFYQLKFTGRYPPDSLEDGFLHDVNLYLENGAKYNITAGTDWDILKDKTKVQSNSSIQDELSLYDNKFISGDQRIRLSVSDKEYELATLLESNPGKKNLDYLRKQIELAKDTAKQYKIKFIKPYAIQHPGSIVIIHKLSRVYDMNENYLQYLDIYSHLEDAIKYNADGIKFKKELDASINNIKHP